MVPYHTQRYFISLPCVEIPYQGPEGMVGQYPEDILCQACVDILDDHLLH